MKATAYLKLSGSLIALTAAAVSQADAQTTATGWTGGSSFHTNAPTAGGAGGGTPIIGDNLWHNPLNWGGGTPNAGVDVSIGLATRDQYYVRYSCNGPGPAPDLDWCENIYDSLRPGSGWDQVMLTGQAGNARNLYIGLAGDRGLKYNSGGPGHLTNESSLTVIQNMVVGQTGVGTYIATGTTTVGGNVVIGGEGNGTVTNTNRMDVGGNLTVGANAKGTLNNTDIVEVEGDITVGQSAQGVFANTGGTVTAVGNFIVGFEAEGEFTNSGTVTVGRNFTVGESGQGTVNNNGAATITVTGNTAIGENAAGIGAITLRNTSSLTTGGTMMVGEHGKGTLVIGTEARAETTGRVTLGTSVSGIGIVSNSGTMINRDRLVVGAMGQGGSSRLAMLPQPQPAMS